MRPHALRVPDGLVVGPRRAQQLDVLPVGGDEQQAHGQAAGTDAALRLAGAGDRVTERTRTLALELLEHLAPPE